VLAVRLRADGVSLAAGLRASLPESVVRMKQALGAELLSTFSAAAARSSRLQVYLGESVLIFVY